VDALDRDLLQDRRTAVEDRGHPRRCLLHRTRMFLGSGDGLVFKGDVGPWYAPDSGEFHLDRRSAKELVALAIGSYKSKHGEKPPRELFLHGKVRFDQEEWAGFREGAGSETNLVGVRIHDSRDIKLYRQAQHPVLRGLAYIRAERTAYLWTRGYVPRLRTYPAVKSRIRS